MQSVENWYFYPTEDLDLDNRSTLHEIIQLKTLPYKILPHIAILLISMDMIPL